MTPRSYFLIKSLYDIYSISSCLKEVEKGDLYDDQYNNSPREGKKENENGNNNEYDHRPTILGGNAGLPNGGKSLYPAAWIFSVAYRFLSYLLRSEVVRCSYFLAAWNEKLSDATSFWKAKNWKISKTPKKIFKFQSNDYAKRLETSWYWTKKLRIGFQSIVVTLCYITYAFIRKCF